MDMDKYLQTQHYCAIHCKCLYRFLLHSSVKNTKLTFADEKDVTSCFRIQVPGNNPANMSFISVAVASDRIGNKDCTLENPPETLEILLFDTDNHMMNDSDEVYGYYGDIKTFYSFQEVEEEIMRVWEIVQKSKN